MHKSVGAHSQGCTYKCSNVQHVFCLPEPIGFKVAKILRIAIASPVLNTALSVFIKC